MVKIRVKKIHSNAIPPIKAHGSARGHDITSLYCTALGPRKGGFISTGLVMEERSDRIIFVLGRLPTEKQQKIEILQSFIETGNEIVVPVRNHNSLEVCLDPYTKLSKFVLLKQAGGAPNVVETLESTERGEKGYGSTGII
ncbi:dUTP pyrophosphatase [Pancytospora epiphaga]|nr:dUTP pyrophosphatase [Pancytospora epiphaga]